MDDINARDKADFGVDDDSGYEPMSEDKATLGHIDDEPGIATPAVPSSPSSLVSDAEEEDNYTPGHPSAFQ